MTRDYDSTIARIAGNIASGLVNVNTTSGSELKLIADTAVRLAKEIVAQLREPVKGPNA